MHLTGKIKSFSPLIIIILFSAFTLFYNLGDRLLWGDEAETALLGVNITKFGVPKVTYGENYVTLPGITNVTNKDDIWIWRPWLDLYFSAASFTLFGKTTTAARLPFAFIAFLSVLFLAYIVQRHYRNKEITLIAILLFVTNVAFILHARQCRYYALIVFAQLSLIYGFHKLISSRSKSGIFFFALALIVQFHSNYMVVLPNLFAIIISVLVIYRRHPHLLRDVLIGFSIFSLFVIPWILFAQPWHQSGYLSAENFAINFIYLLSQVNFYIVPVVLLLIPAIMHFTRKGKEVGRSNNIMDRSFNVFLWSIIPAYLLILSIAPDLFFRYLLPLIPVCIILLSVIVVDYIRPLSLRYLLIALLSFSNIFPVLFAFPPKINSVSMPVVQFLNEITSKYDNKLEDVVNFLQKNASPGESIYVADTEFPIIFYTGMHIINARFNSPDENDLPDWVFVNIACPDFEGPELKIPPRFINRYKLVVLHVHNSPPCDSCPEPIVHMFTSSDKMIEFKIYKKIS